LIAEHLHDLDFPNGLVVGIYRNPEGIPIRCWRCDERRVRFGYPFGRYQDPNCQDCIRRLRRDAWDAAEDDVS